jgi:uncharacterized Zn finger protein (UPF0148 family)
MICPKCQALGNKSWLFCPWCGTELQTEEDYEESLQDAQADRDRAAREDPIEFVVARDGLALRIRNP